LSSIVWLLTSKASCGCIVEGLWVDKFRLSFSAGSRTIAYLETAFCTKVDLDVHKGTVILEPLECVPGVPVLLVIAVWGSTIREEDHDLVDRFWVLREIVLERCETTVLLKRSAYTYPEHIGILQMGLGIPLLGVYEVGKLGRVANKEDRGVVENPVPVSLFSP
jgi:hypothetical protein